MELKWEKTIIFQNQKKERVSQCPKEKEDATKATLKYYAMV